MMSTQTTILIAENTALGRWALTHALQARGFEVYSAATWVEAVGWLGRAEVAVALVSTSLEPARWPEMCSYARTHHPLTRLVLLAAEDELHEVRARCGSGTAVFAKPIDVEQVVAAVQEIVQDDRSALRA